MLLLLWSACCTPPEDGPLADGAWGEPGGTNALTVQDGEGTLYLGCAFGVGVVEVVDGEIDATFTFDPDNWGPDDAADEEPMEVDLVATVCGNTMDAHALSGNTAVVPDASFDLRLGVARDLAECAE